MKKHVLFLIVLSIFAADKLSAQLTATTTGTNPSCANNNGVATVNPTGGNAYTYKWSNGATTASAAGLAAGTYTVTVYSSAGTVWDTLYLETFDATQTWTLNISTGTNGADPNFWTVSDAEGGVAPPGCGTASNGNKTMHITSVFNSSGGAAYDAGGLCGFYFCPQTSAAAESPNIATTGATNLVLSYDFIGGGQGLTDNASTLYSINGGTNFTSIDPSLKSGTAGCAGQGKWTKRSLNLPTNCNNLNNFKLRFNWVNNDDGVGTDPSVAINNVMIRDSLPGTADSVVKTVTLTLPVGPHFATNALSVANPGCNQSNGSINNMGVTGGTTPYSLAWSLGGVQIGTSNSIANLGAGTYTFEVTDGNGCVIDTAFTLVPTTAGGPTAITTNKVIFCAYDTATVCVTNTTNIVSYAWNLGGTTACIKATTAGNYRVTVTDNNGCTAVSNQLTISVYPLPPVSISVNGDTLTAVGAVSYQWYRNNVIIPGAIDSIYKAAAPGSYTVRIGDSNGCQVVSNAVIISGINDLKTTLDFEIYPNPITSGNWTLAAAKELMGAQAEIVDVNGRLVYKAEINQLKTEINTGQLSDGIYFIKISSGKTTVTRKLIKL